MKLVITAAASQWFLNHLQLKANDGVKFFGTTVQPRHVQHTPDQGFAKEDNLSAAVLTVSQDGVNYHINLADEWFFSGRVTTVDLAEGDSRPRFTFQKESVPTTAPADPATPATDADTAASRRYEGYWE
ncbi:MAG: HesB/YadR/YfhF family protein [Limosilactobacillus sp.]